MSNPTDMNWEYVNVRYQCFLIGGVSRSTTQFAVFEPNGTAAWDGVGRSSSSMKPTHSSVRAPRSKISMTATQTLSSATCKNDWRPAAIAKKQGTASGLIVASAEFDGSSLSPTERAYGNGWPGAELNFLMSGILHRRHEHDAGALRSRRNNGPLGIAPDNPAEFIIVRIQRNGRFPISMVTSRKSQPRRVVLVVSKRFSFSANFAWSRNPPSPRLHRPVKATSHRHR